MVLFLLSTLTFSIVGLGVLIGAKEWELETGRVILAGSRPGLARHLCSRVDVTGTCAGAVGGARDAAGWRVRSPSDDQSGGWQEAKACSVATSEAT